MKRNLTEQSVDSHPTPLVKKSKTTKNSSVPVKKQNTPKTTKKSSAPSSRRSSHQSLSCKMDDSLPDKPDKKMTVDYEAQLRAKDSQTFNKMELRDHILMLPDTYIGSVKPSMTEDVWLAEEDPHSNIGYKMVCRNAMIVDGLYKIFDEVVQNAADNVPKTRDHIHQDPTIALTTQIKITLSPTEISVWNNGEGIPIVMHSEHKDLIPDIVFGELLTSGNYDQKEQKRWGGKNGYGSKCTSIYSTSFTVETVDHRRQLKYKRTWVNNMDEKSSPAKVTPFTKAPYTKVTFCPDFTRFGVTDLSGDMMSLLTKRVIDLAGILPADTSVYLNGKKIHLRNFQHYTELYLDKSVKRVYEQPHEWWEVVVCPSPDGSFRHISFVNNIFTSKGGKHVQYVSSKICRTLADRINGKKNATTLSYHHIKNNLWIFVNVSIVNPAFSSQTKTDLITPYAEFGSKFDDFTDKFYRALEKTEVVELAKGLKDIHDRKGLEKTDGRKTVSVSGIPKLEDANWAGGKKSSQCTLILTEGDSAKTFALSGLGVVGRDKYGIFPLKGKPLNVRDADLDDIAKNVEISYLKKILGLKEDTRTIQDLRYGRIMLLSDQDRDGSHIKGLVMNLFDSHPNWKHLLRQDFITSMYTRVVAVRRGKKIVKDFYSTTDFDAWKKTHSLKGLTIKYYKGLGTSTKEDAKAYFTTLDTIIYDYDEKASEAMDLAFNKKKADQRKEWLIGSTQETLNYTIRRVTYSDFIHKELIFFSMEDNNRSLPSMVDGLKESQRKVLYGMLKRNQVSEEKVSQIVGPIGSMTDYHHGEKSLEGTILNMAQDYVGSNNINLFEPAGQFGSRQQGGKDAASSRYIFTYLRPIAKKIFKDEDRPLLVHQETDNTPLEPVWFLPVLPWSLVNGADGIGTGFSTRIAPYNPRDLIAALRDLMEGKEPKPLVPWFRKFKGKVTQTGAHMWQTEGVWKIVPQDSIHISELPIGRWTEDYMTYIDAQKNEGKIHNYTLGKQDDEKVDMILKFKPEEFKKLVESPHTIAKNLKLTSSFSTNNLHMMDPYGHIVKFNSPESILKAFYEFRLPYYERRRVYSMQHLEKELACISQKVRFVEGILSQKLQIFKRPKDQVLHEVRDVWKFPPDPIKCAGQGGFLPSKHKYATALLGKIKTRGLYAKTVYGLLEEKQDTTSDISTQWVESPHIPDSEDVSPNKILRHEYGYLFDIPVYNLTQEMVLQLQASCIQKQEELRVLQSITARQLWEQDLAEIEAILD